MWKLRSDFFVNLGRAVCKICQGLWTIDQRLPCALFLKLCQDFLDALRNEFLLCWVKLLDLLYDLLEGFAHGDTHFLSAFSHYALVSFHKQVLEGQW